MRLYTPPVPALLVPIAFGWLLLFAHHGLGAPFSGDDLMNLHGHLSRSAASLILDNLRYWSTSHRPLGGLCYVAIYNWFGFDPLPFRVLCFGLLALNLGLLWRFTLHLSGSREVAFLALLVAGYHAWFVDLYYSTGTIYDLLCYAFYLGAFDVYAAARARGHDLSRRELWTVAGLYLCALNSKEMAVTLPVILGAFEVIYMGPCSRWAWRGVLLTGLASAPYVAGKLMGSGSLVENPAYRLAISPVRYLHAFHLYLNPLLYQEHVFRDANTVQLLLGMLAFALWRRSRPLLFAWCFVTVSLLPVAFIAHYAGFFLYLPMAGWSLYAAVLLAMARRSLVRLLLRATANDARVSRLRAASVAALPVLVALFLAPYHRQESAKTLRIFQSAQPPTRQLAAEMKALRPGLPRGGRVMFAGDPFPKDEYFLLFLTRLLYRDMSLTVERAPAAQGAGIARGRYDAVFAFDGGHLVDASARTAAAECEFR